MNRPPEIIVNSGFVTDQNGVLTELVIPASVTTVKAPTKIVDYSSSLNSILTDKTVLQEYVYMGTDIAFTSSNLFWGLTAFTTFSAPNCVSITTNDPTSGNTMCRPFSGSTLSVVNLPNLTSYSHPVSRQNDTSRGLFAGCSSLVNLTLPKLTSITVKGVNSVSNRDCPAGFCSSCSNLTDVSLPLLEIFDNSGGGSLFHSCPSIMSLSFPSLRSVNTGGVTFKACTGLLSVDMPLLATMTISQNGSGLFSGCTSLQQITLGSIGHPLSSIPANTFYNCTQSNLTITIYTVDGLPLSGSPWGATNTQPNFVQA